MRNTSRQIDLNKETTKGKIKIVKGSDGWKTISLYNTDLAIVSFSGQLTLIGTDWTSHTTIMTYNTILAECGWNNLKVYKKGEGLALYYVYSEKHQIFEEIMELEKGQQYEIGKIWADYEPDVKSLDLIFKNKLLRTFKEDFKWFFKGNPFNTDKTLAEVKSRAFDPINIKKPLYFKTDDFNGFLEELWNEAAIKYFGSKEAADLAMMLETKPEQFN
jgi:hypothetical protein